MKIILYIANLLNKYFHRFLLSKNPWFPFFADQVYNLKTADPDYFVWLIKNKYLYQFALLLKPFRLNRFDIRFSVVMPVYNTLPDHLEKAVKSVMNQIYAQWELIICDDFSTSQETLGFLEKLSNMDPRIRIIHNKSNSGISESTNNCVNQAGGDFVVLVDHDDEIYPDALLKLKEAIKANPDKNVFYSDEDFISPGGKRYKYLFKPGFSPALLETHNYILHLLCVRRKVYLENGGLRKDYDGSQDYDFLLRLMDNGEFFVHIPDVLYSWREAETSMAGGCFKPAVFQKGKMALEDHFKRTCDQVVDIKNSLIDIPGVYKTQFGPCYGKKIFLIDRSGTYKPIEGFSEEDIEVCRCLNKSVGEVNDIFLSVLDREDVFIVVYVEKNIVPDSWKNMMLELASYACREKTGIVCPGVFSHERALLLTGQAMIDQGILTPVIYESSEYHAGYGRMKNVLSVHGYVYALKRDVLRELLLKFGPIKEPENFHVELSLRALRLNYWNVYNPFSTVVLKGWRKDGEDTFPQALGILKQNDIICDPFVNRNLNYSGYRWGLTSCFSEKPDDGEVISRKTEYEEWLSRIRSNAGIFLDQIEIPADIRFSIIIPVYSCSAFLFRQLMDSILNQSYENYEVCISDDGSTDVGIKELLKKYSRRHKNIKVVFSEKNSGIAENTNKALEMAKGDYLVFADQDDLMEHFALRAFALSIFYLKGVADVLYSDEDKIDIAGNRFDPRLNPDWDPEMLLSHMYCPHLLCIRRRLVEEVGGFDSSLSGAQDYDLLLKVTERSEYVKHVPLILYSWRVSEGSTASDPADKIYAYESGRRALINAMKRRDVDAKVFKSPLTHLGVYRVKRGTKQEKSVSHVVEIKTLQDLYGIYSLKNMSDYKVQLIGVIEKSNALLISAAESDTSCDIVIRVDDGAGLSRIYNQGTQAADHENLIFSASGTELLNSDYPGAIHEHLGREEIGAVGIKLMYPSGVYFHTGIILGVNGVAGYAHRNLYHSPGYQNYAACIRGYSVVSWRFIGVHRDKYEAVGGFDEILTTFGDVDFCLKLKKAGFSNLYTPYCVAVVNRKVHFLEELRNAEEEKVILERYGDIISNDPMYHPFLSRQLENFAVNVEGIDMDRVCF